MYIYTQCTGISIWDMKICKFLPYLESVPIFYACATVELQFGGDTCSHMYSAAQRQLNKNTHVARVSHACHSRVFVKLPLGCTVYVYTCTKYRYSTCIIILQQWLLPFLPTLLPPSPVHSLWGWLGLLQLQHRGHQVLCRRGHCSRRVWSVWRSGTVQR